MTGYVVGADVGTSALKAVLAPCIHWTDRRDPEETRQLYDGLGRSRLIDRSGTLPISGPLTISDGEARNQLWNQIKADVTGRTITPAVRAEAPSIGAAILAGLGAGLFGSVADALAVVLELAPPLRPDPAATAQYAALRTQWERVRGQVFPALGAN